MKGQKFLKVTGILMIIGAALSILFGVIIGGVGALIAKFAGASTLGFAFYLGLATTLVGGKFNVLSFVIGLIVPGLYIYGAFLNHKENAR